MKTRVQKWGNSLAVRIPRAFAADAGIEQGTLVDVSVREESVIVSPLEDAEPTPEELLAGITDDNIHSAWVTGPAGGRETW